MVLNNKKNINFDSQKISKGGWFFFFFIWLKITLLFKISSISIDRKKYKQEKQNIFRVLWWALL